MKKILSLITILLSLACFNQAFASKISVSNVILDFQPGKQKFQDIVVKNETQDETAYVKIDIFEVQNPGTEKEKKVAITKKSGEILVVSPQKFSIPVKGRKKVRFISLHKNLKKDKIYRVRVAPVLGDVSVDAGNFVKVLIAYEVLVNVRPNKVDANFTAKRKGRKIYFKNTGNSNVLLREGKQCISKNECEKYPGRRLYAGTEFTQELKFDQPVEYTYSAAEGIKTESF